MARPLEAHGGFIVGRDPNTVCKQTVWSRCVLRPTVGKTDCCQVSLFPPVREVRGDTFGVEEKDTFGMQNTTVGI